MADGEALHKAPHSHHSSSTTTPNWPVKIAYDVERHVNPNATHLKLTLTKNWKKYKKCFELRKQEADPSI